jgi:hypothetical protein
MRELTQRMDFKGQGTLFRSIIVIPSADPHPPGVAVSVSLAWVPGK